MLAHAGHVVSEELCDARIGRLRHGPDAVWEIRYRARDAIIGEVFTVADGVSDQPTCDLLTQRMQVHEKTAWMLRSLLE